MRPEHEVAGLRIGYERAGGGPPVVLLHGGLSDSREWRRQIDALSDEFTVVAWDAPGCGRSADPPASFRMADYADCLAALIEELELMRPHVVGLSFGGTLALELYRRHPGVPRTLVLASAYAGWAGSLPPDLVTKRLNRALHELDEPSELVARRWVPELLTGRAPPEMVEELVEIIADFRPGGCRTMAHAMAEADLRADLPRIEVATLLLYGADDPRSPRRVREELAAGIRPSRLVVLPDVGHQLNMEAAARFNAELREFLHASSTGRNAPTQGA